MLSSSISQKVLG